MGFIGDLFSGDSGFQAQSANVISPVMAEDAQKAMQEAGLSVTRQRDFVSQLEAQNAVRNQADVFAQQQQLARALEAQASGAAPSIAQQQLAQTTGQNIAAQAALLAGQRGGSGNVGLQARQIAQAGAGVQQQAAGQGALLRLQEQLAARQQLQNQQQLLAGLSTQQVGQQAQATQAYGAQAQNQQQILLNAINAQNQANVANVEQQNQANAQTAAAARQAQGNLFGNIFNAAGALVPTLIGGPAGVAASIAGGGAGGASPYAGTPGAGGLLAGVFNEGGVAKVVPGQAEVKGDSIKNDKVPAILSPGEVVLPRSVINAKDPGAAAKKFVEALKAKGQLKKNFAEGGIVEEGEAPQPVAQIPQQPVVNINVGQPAAPGPAPVMAAPSAYAPPPANEMAALQNQAYLQGQPEAQAAPAPAKVDRGLAAATPEVKPVQIAQPQAQPTDMAQDIGIAGLMSGMAKQQAGIQAEQRAAEKEAASRLATLEAAGQQMKNAQDLFREKEAELTGRRAQLRQAIEEQAIDPKRYLSSMNGGQKILTTIGLLVSGLGAGLSGRENMAMKVINDNIERDIRAQEKELGKKENLLAENLREYGNLRDATAMTRVMMADMVGFELNKAAALAGSERAKAAALMAQGQLDAQYAPLLKEAAMRRAVMAGVGQEAAGDVTKTTRAINSVVPENQRAAALKELADYKAIQENLKAVGPMMREAYKNTTLAENVKNPIQAAQRRERAFAQLFPIAKAIAGERMTDADARSLITPYLPGITTNEETLNQNIAALKQQLLTQSRGRTPVLQAYNLLPADQPANAFTEQQQALYQWAKSNPKDPRAEKVLARLGVQ